MQDCPLCRGDGGTLLWRGALFRVVEVPDQDYPGYTRVIWNAHVAEQTDLPLEQRELLMRAVYAVEQTQRDVLRPDKINLAALGNMVPHLHWHVIARWRGDRHFPDAIWAAPRLDSNPNAARIARLPDYQEKLVAALDALRF